MKITVWMSCLVLASLFFASCGKSPGAAPASQPLATAGVLASTAEQPLPRSPGAAGDIPDTQAFVTFRSAIGKYSVDVPEGWARTEDGADVKFTNHFDGEQVSIRASAAAPAIDSVQRDQVPAIREHARAVIIDRVNSTTLANAAAVITISYGSNSDPDPVTGKRVRLSNVGTLFYRQGKIAILTLWAPTGADNTDEWKHITESFQWH